MNRQILFIACALAALALGASPARMLAQDAPAPIPQPSDPLLYVDDAMTYRAPDTMLLLGRHPIAPRALSGQLQPVAEWRTKPGKGNNWVIVVSQEGFEGDVEGWATGFQNELREQVDGVFVRHVTNVSLKNGMPARFLEIAMGEGFTSQKQFAVIWSDGVRGCAITATARLGDIDEASAKPALLDATAVLYPKDRL